MGLLHRFNAVHDENSAVVNRGHVRCLALSDPRFQATIRSRLAGTSSYEYFRYIRRSATAMGQAACRADDARSYRVWLAVRTWLKQPHAAERKVVDATSSSSYFLSYLRSRCSPCAPGSSAAP